MRKVPHMAIIVITIFVHKLSQSFTLMLFQIRPL